ncbi:hypothetical protein COO60DRAFT_513803 [Scenedesmus sp. NREL 46B-D3]|nr:hypothetical protein COO60DRAFT_513803 [Scenedesmus sp. NREL 46B-D3]
MAQYSGWIQLCLHEQPACRIGRHLLAFFMLECCLCFTCIVCVELLMNTCSTALRAHARSRDVICTLRLQTLGHPAQCDTVLQQPWFSLAGCTVSCVGAVPQCGTVLQQPWFPCAAADCTANAGAELNNCDTGLHTIIYITHIACTLTEWVI